MNVNFNSPSQITVSAYDSDNDSMTYTRVGSPANGSITGTGPNYTYTPANGYYGSDTFSFKTNDGSVDSNVASVSITVIEPTIYLRGSADSPAGDDSSGQANNPLHPFLTAQAAVNAAISQAPAADKPVTIDVGALSAGNFGDVIVTQNFGQFVTWRGVDSTYSVIGNISADGANGASGVDDGNQTPANGSAGSPGQTIYINADSSIRFGDISANGGGGGAAYEPSGDAWPGDGGAGGSISIGATVIAGNLSASGGNYGYSNFHGASAGVGGSIVVSTGSQVGTVSALGATSSGGQNEGMGSAGGSVVVAGTTSHIDVSGGVGSVYGTTHGGNAGMITILSSGTSGNLNANGGRSFSSGTAGNGGTIVVSGHVANIVAEGGPNDTNDAGGDGGSVTLNNGAVASNISISGGSASDPGLSGTLLVAAGAQAANITANSGCGTSGCIGGNILINGAVNEITNGTIASVFGISSGLSVTIGATGVASTIRAVSGNVVVQGTAGSIYVDSVGTGDIMTYMDAGTVQISASGQAGDIFARGSGYSNGNGGTVVVSGTAGNIFAYGDSSFGIGGRGNGGVVTINAGASVQNISANGGYCDNTYNAIAAGSGGTVVVSGSAGVVSANGGGGIEGGSGGGSIRVNSGASTSNLSAVGGDGLNQGGGGGQIIYSLSSSSSTLAALKSVNGGSGDVNNGGPGAIGSVSTIP